MLVPAPGSLFGRTYPLQLLSTALALSKRAHGWPLHKSPNTLWGAQQGAQKTLACAERWPSSAAKSWVLAKPGAHRALAAIVGRPSFKSSLPICSSCFHRWPWGSTASTRLQPWIWSLTRIRSSRAGRQQGATCWRTPPLMRSLCTRCGAVCTDAPTLPLTTACAYRQPAHWHPTRHYPPSPHRSSRIRPPLLRQRQRRATFWASRVSRRTGSRG